MAMQVSPLWEELPPQKQTDRHGSGLQEGWDMRYTDGDHLRVVQESVEDRGCGRHVADQLAPILDGPIRGHHRRARLVADGLNQMTLAS